MSALPEPNRPRISQRQAGLLAQAARDFLGSDAARTLSYEDEDALGEAVAALERYAAMPRTVKVRPNPSVIARKGPRW